MITRVTLVDGRVLDFSPHERIRWVCHEDSGWELHRHKADSQAEISAGDYLCLRKSLVEVESVRWIDLRTPADIEAERQQAREHEQRVLLAQSMDSARL